MEKIKEFNSLYPRHSEVCISISSQGSNPLVFYIGGGLWWVFEWCPYLDAESPHKFLMELSGRDTVLTYLECSVFIEGYFGMAVGLKRVPLLEHKFDGEAFTGKSSKLWDKKKRKIVKKLDKYIKIVENMSFQPGTSSLELYKECCNYRFNKVD